MSISSPGSMRSEKLFADAMSQEHAPLRVSLPVPMSEENLDAGGCASTEVDLFVEGCGPTARDLDEEWEGVFNIPPFPGASATDPCRPAEKRIRGPENPEGAKDDDDSMQSATSGLSG